MAYYFVGRYNDAVDACDRALSRDPGRNIQMLTHPMLAATSAEMGRQQDAEGERAIVAHLWPFFDARIGQGFSQGLPDGGRVIAITDLEDPDIDGSGVAGLPLAKRPRGSPRVRRGEIRGKYLKYLNSRPGKQVGTGCRTIRHAAARDHTLEGLKRAGFH